MATEMRSAFRDYLSRVAQWRAKSRGTTATETLLITLAPYHRNDWHNMTEMAGTMATELSSRCQCFLKINEQLIRDLLFLGAIRLDYIQHLFGVIRVGITEHNFVVDRPGRILAVGQQLLISPIGIHDIDCYITAPGYLLTIRRPGWTSVICSIIG